MEDGKYQGVVCRQLLSLFPPIEGWKEMEEVPPANQGWPRLAGQLPGRISTGNTHSPAIGAHDGLDGLDGSPFMLVVRHSCWSWVRYSTGCATSSRRPHFAVARHQTMSGIKQA
jgi:hypothetical protein